MDRIKNNEEIEIIQLEEYDAVVTVLAYFNYFQCQRTEVAEYIARYNVLRIIKDPKAAEHIHGLRKKMFVTEPDYFCYFQCRTTDDDSTTAKLRVLNIHG